MLYIRVKYLPIISFQIHLQGYLNRTAEVCFNHYTNQIYEKHTEIIADCECGVSVNEQLLFVVCSNTHLVWLMVWVVYDGRSEQTHIKDASPV